jgi:eukaryotic-like serine/threonine-protein kinase
MTTFPAAGDYYKAVQAPARVFTVPKLQAAKFVWDSLGPTLARGSSAVVFQATVDGTPQALRCYIRNDASSRERYSALGDYLARSDLSPYVSGTTWLDQAIRVNRETWPVLQMSWIDGRTLNEYVDFLVTGANTAALATLAANWREMIARLQSAQFTHGDLQHGNVMVDQQGQLRLVDFDGVWIPQLAGQDPPTEYGHPNYQRPGRHDWGPWFDTFSALVIYTSLVALSKDPSLWLALYNSKNLLFCRDDFFAPFSTEVWKQLAALRDPQVNELTQRLQERCAPDWKSDRSLEAILDPPAPASGELRWWEKQPSPPKAAAAPKPSSVTEPPTQILRQLRPQPTQPPQTLPPAAAAQPAPEQEALPTPPPLSTPLTSAGTGPMPQLRQTMAPPGATWWSGPGSAPAPAPIPPPPVPSAKPRQTAGALSLGIGLLFLLAGAVGHTTIVLVIGLIAAAWGIWRLVTLTGTGNNTKPPGQPGP